MSDLICRKAAIALAKDICVPTKDGVIYRHRCIDPGDIAELPSAKSKWEWIPVEKMLPKENLEVLVCNQEGNIEICCGWPSTEFPDEWIWCTSGWRFGDVIAWMPLPEPYVK